MNWISLHQQYQFQLICIKIIMNVMILTQLFSKLIVNFWLLGFSTCVISLPINSFLTLTLLVPSLYLHCSLSNSLHKSKHAFQGKTQHDPWVYPISIQEVKLEMKIWWWWWWWWWQLWRWWRCRWRWGMLAVRSVSALSRSRSRSYPWSPVPP